VVRAGERTEPLGIGTRERIEEFRQWRGRDIAMPRNGIPVRFSEFSESEKVT